VADDQPAGAPVTSTTVAPRSDLGLRVVSSVVLAPLALGAAYAGGWTFAAFWGMAAIGVLVEWIGIIGEPRRMGGIIAGAGAVAAATILAAQHHYGFALLLLGIGMIAAAALATDRRIWNAAGVVYAGAIAVAPIILRADSTLGLTAVVVIFAVVWATDILGYCVGRVVGGAKLAASISPKKTWSGSIGGTFGAVLAMLAIAAYAHLQDLAILAVVAVILSVVSQAGDLCESAIKRRFGVKDASHIIPGHGGLMDRLDGFVTAASLAAIIGVARGGFDAAGRGLLTW